MSRLCEAVVVVLLAVPAFAQSQALAVISVKPARADNLRGMRMRVLPNGNLTATAVPLVLLVSDAYDVPVNPSPRLSGLPGWPERYDIGGKAPAGAVRRGLPESEKRRHIERPAGEDD